VKARSAPELLLFELWRLPPLQAIAEGIFQSASSLAHERTARWITPVSSTTAYRWSRHPDDRRGARRGAEPGASLRREVNIVRPMAAIANAIDSDIFRRLTALPMSRPRSSPRWSPATPTINAENAGRKTGCRLPLALPLRGSLPLPARGVRVKVGALVGEGFSVERGAGG
jgi:hypothetical protein